jgi:hypothetical protein
MSGPRLRLPTVPYGAFRALIGLLLRSEVTLIGAAHIPDGPCLAVSNHPNREEILLGYRIFRRPVRIVVQPGLMDADFLAAEIDQALAGQYRFPRFVRRLGPLLADWIARQNRRLGCIPVVREKDSTEGTAANRRALRLTLEALERGEVVGMSGEGGLSPEAGVGRVERGAAAIAVHAARRGRPVPVLPIIFHGMRRLEHSLLGRGRCWSPSCNRGKPPGWPRSGSGSGYRRYWRRCGGGWSPWRTRRPPSAAALTVRPTPKPPRGVGARYRIRPV